MLSRTLAVLAAATLVFGSSAAVAQSAQPLSLANAPAVERAGADVAGASELRGTTGWIIGAIALGLIIWGAIELLDDDEDTDSP
jgi:hypothetical protein